MKFKNIKDLALNLKAEYVMQLFQLYGSQDYWSIYFKDKDYIEIEDKWNLVKKGISIAKDWKKVEVKIVFKGKQRKNKPDIIDFGGCAGIAISSQAKDTLKSLLMPYCELLSVNLRGIEIYIINPITVLDCLDYDNSIIELAPPLYNYQRIIKYVLKKEIKYPPIFRNNLSESLSQYIQGFLLPFLLKSPTFLPKILGKPIEKCTTLRSYL